MRYLQPVSVAQGVGKGGRTESINGEQQQHGNGAGGEENRQRGGGADVSHPQHKSQRGNQQQPEGKLCRHADGDGKSQQQDAPPVPQHHFARRIQRVRHGDGGEDQPKAAPCAQHLRADLARGADDGGREAVKAERDVAAEIAVKPPRHVPQGSSQQRAEEDEGQTNGQAIVADVGEILLAAAKTRRHSGDKRHQWRAQRRGGGGKMLEFDQPALNDVALAGGERQVRRKPQALQQECRQQDQCRPLRRSHGRSKRGRGHESFVVTQPEQWLGAS